MSDLFGMRLRAARLRAGLPQTALAVAMGDRYTHTDVSRFESGQRKPRLDGLVNAARELGVSVDYLLGVVDQEQPSGTNLEERTAANGGQMASEDNSAERDLGLTPEQVLEDFKLVVSEDNLHLKVQGSSLTVEDISGIANYIRFVHERERQLREGLGASPDESRPEEG